MGREALDGDFLTFQARILAMDVLFGDNVVRCTTLRGDTLTLTWDGPLTVNGEPQSARRSKHFENPYTTSELGSRQMEIRHGADSMRLDFSA